MTNDDCVRIHFRPYGAPFSLGHWRATLNFGPKPEYDNSVDNAEMMFTIPIVEVGEEEFVSGPSFFFGPKGNLNHEGVSRWQSLRYSPQWG